MVYSGPQKYPGASTAYWYQDTYGGDRMESNVVVWHTTEGTSLPSYGGGASAPNFTAKPDFARKRLVWYQHFDFDRSSRALVNKSGGVETNTLNVCQVEIVGTCDPTTHKKWTAAGYRHLYTPELPDWAVRDLAAFAKWAHDQHGVPLSSGVTFKAYPSSYGASNGVRMSGSQWNNFRGHCGHQHVPENDHGDPGAFPMAAILTAAKGGTINTGGTVALTTDDVKKIVKTDGIIKSPNSADPGVTNDFWTLESYQYETYHRVLETKAAAQAAADAVKAISATGLTDAQVQAIADKVAAIVAPQVADLIAARLEA